jgi:PERQ amino acid-rich with GYF domain-containing protein
LFASSVNSPHKAPPNQNIQGATSHHSTNHTPPQNRSKITAPPGTGTPSVNRPTNRRRETSDAALPNSPFNSAPPQLPRRRTDLRDEDQTREGGGRDRTLFGRWGSTSGTTGPAGDDEDGSGSGGRGPGLFRRGSTAWGPGGSTGGSGITSSALNSPMGTFGNGVFGGAMGGFSLQSASSEKLKASGGGAGNTGKGSTAQPKVEEEDEHAENTQRPRSPNANELREEHERERPMSSDTDPFGLGGDGDDHEHGQRQEQQQQQQQHSPLPTPGLEQRIKDNSFNMTSNAQTRQGNSVSTPTKVCSDLGFSGIGTTRDGSNVGGLHQQLQNLQLNQQGHFPLHGRSREGSIGGIIGGLHENEPLSPTETNPYQSPAPEKADDDDMPESSSNGGGIIGGFRRSDVGAPGSDRSGRSSTAGLGSGLASFSSLSGTTLWGGTSGPSGLGNNTATSSFFGGNMLGDLNSPNTIGSGGPFSGGGIGGMGSIGSGGFGSASRASRLGQLFQQEPQVEEEQQPQQQQQQQQQGGFESNDALGDLRFGNAFGSGRSGFGSAVDSPMRERPAAMDIFNLHTTRSIGNLGAAASGDNTLYPRERDDSLPGIHSLHQNQPAQPAPLSAGIQPPAVQPPPQIRPPPGTVAPQQHVMVMPDKIQWTYRDPSGTVQGPFSGLEMHDWYKAGFFTPDLAVKRVEDPEFEQLGNLVRRIGNTREPFLVPLQAPANSALVQPATSQPNTWPGVAAWLSENQQPPQTAGTVQPPFAGSFPSFGTTLTADQQNALERRKQEEQYLLARQREYLVQQQVFAKAQHALHHQHSQQSLHSQPSFGSLQGNLQSPGGFGTPVTATTVGIGGQNSFEPGVLLRQAGAAAGGADAFGAGGHGMSGMAGQQLQQNSQFAQQQQQQVQADRLQMEQQRILEMQRQQVQKAYQTQHQQVEKQQEIQQAQQQAVAAAAQAQQHAQSYEAHHIEREDERSSQQTHQEHGGTVPVQHDKVPSPALESSAWGIAPETVKPQAQPQAPEQPKVSIPKATPSTRASPRPTQAQITSSNDWQDSESVRLVQPFPPPPTAPWANKDNEVKQPSLTLKEIQEIEAEQQRNKEAYEAEQRRQLMAQQAANQPPPPAPGLPSTATWATSPSATPATGSASAWAKPLVKANSLPSAGAKKTLSQIQKEEEARKAKAAALAASTAQAAAQIPSAPLASGKRYADLASKTSQPMASGAWTTVGPGGKSKLGASGPTGPLPSTPTAPVQPLRTVSSTIGIQTAKKVAPVVAPVKPTATSAEGEFHKWAMASLTGLKEGVKGIYEFYACAFVWLR